jgi:sialic acid synthase SpsE
MQRVKVDKDTVAKRLQFMKDIFEKSVVSLTEIAAGTLITEAMVGVKKPGTGIPARDYKKVIGRRAARNIACDALLHEEDLDA